MCWESDSFKRHCERSGRQSSSYSKFTQSFRMANDLETHRNNGYKNGINSIHSSSSDVTTVAQILGLDIVHYVSNNNKYVSSVSSSVQTMAARPVVKTLRRTVDELSQRHEILFKGMVKKLNITVDNMEQVFVNIADEIFKDKQYNWGRIVSVYAFGGRMAKYASDNHLSPSVDFVGEFVGSYVAQNLGWWIEKNGGWDAFRTYFPDKLESKLEDNLWRGLLATAGFGLAALAAVVVVR